MEDPDHPQPPFQLVKRVQDNIWLTRRVARNPGYADGEEFITRKVDDFDEYYEAGKYSMSFTTKRQRQVKGLMNLLYDCNLGRNMSHIFNHENIISLAGYLRQQPVHPRVDATEDYLVWDICDAGTLENLLASPDAEREPGCFLPESLCWHVLVSIMRALVWLHDGYRQEVNWVTGERRWMKTDAEWMPILHRRISAETVFFQHSRGRETYGVCKLGKFGNAFVSGVPARRDGAPEGEKPLPHTIGFPVAPKEGHMGLTDMTKQWKEYLDTGRNSKRLYTLSDEHWALGAVLFRMMVGDPLPSLDGCKACRCIHIRRCVKADCAYDGKHLSCECQHDTFRGCRCPTPCQIERDAHIDKTLDRVGYSSYLTLAVRILLNYDLRAPAVGTQALADEVEVLYRRWRNETQDGQEYVDVEDDLGYRFLVLNNAAAVDTGDEMDERVIG
ncbi:g2-specific serine threonine protein kinase [Colletotrichum incanum]|nr:g2-specific serine threonine protein kinase [Colletotrichum incanum]